MTKPHLHVFLTPPEGYPPTAIVVHITTYEEDCEDPTVILKGGEHPFIVHPSYVWYAQGGREDVLPLVTAIEQGIAEQRERCSPELLKLLREGFLRSDEVSRRLKKELVASVQAEMLGAAVDGATNVDL